MLLTVIEKLNAIEADYGGKKSSGIYMPRVQLRTNVQFPLAEDDMMPLCTADDAALVSLMKTELLEEDNHEDPDFHLPEEAGENSMSSSVSRTYNFRPRNRMKRVN